MIAAFVMLSFVRVDGTYLVDFMPASIVMGIGFGMAAPAMTGLACRPSPRRLRHRLRPVQHHAADRRGDRPGRAERGGGRPHRRPRLGGGRSQAEVLVGGYHAAFLLAAGFVVVGMIMARSCCASPRRTAGHRRGRRVLPGGPLRLLTADRGGRAAAHDGSPRGRDISTCPGPAVRPGREPRRSPHPAPSCAGLCR